MKLFYLQTWFIFLQAFATMPSSSTTSVEDWKLSKFSHWWCTMFYGNLVCLYCYCLEYYKQITIIIMQVPIWKFWIIYNYVNSQFLELFGCENVHAWKSPTSKCGKCPLMQHFAFVIEVSLIVFSTKGKLFLVFYRFQVYNSITTFFVLSFYY